MNRYRDTILAVALFLFALIIIAGAFLWMVRGVAHDFLPEEGIYHCEKLNVTIDLSQRNHTISLGDISYPMEIAYSGEISYITDEQSGKSQQYGYVKSGCSLKKTECISMYLR